MDLHETLATKHREYEARVNYFKAKVKNLVTLENSRISKENANKITEYSTNLSKVNREYNDSYTLWRAQLDKALQEFEAAKSLKIKEIASLRISVDPRFQQVIGEILGTIKMADKELA